MLLPKYWRFEEKFEDAMEGESVAGVGGGAFVYDELLLLGWEGDLGSVSVSEDASESASSSSSQDSATGAFLAGLLSLEAGAEVEIERPEREEERDLAFEVDMLGGSTSIGMQEL